MVSEPALSVIISTYNHERHLELALAGWARQSHGNFEVIVVDDSGSDGVRARLKSWDERLPLRWLVLDHQGRGNARNRGIRAADGEQVVIADDDCVVGEHFLREIAADAAGVRVGRRHGMLARWARHLPGCWTPRLRNVLAHRPSLGPTLTEKEQALFTVEEFEQRFDEVLAEFRIEDPLWERLDPARAEPAALGWLFGMAGPVCLDRRAAFEVGLYDPLDRGRDLEVPEFVYRLQKSGLPLRVVEDARAFRIARQWESWPQCGFAALERFAQRHDPVDAWLLLRFLTGEPIGELNQLAASRTAGSLTDSQLVAVARELVPQIIADLKVWWYPA